ncbi:tRNA (guanosine(46)-N7)-methyltransferase TrmB [Prauserella sp. PE36]|uniref:tRNA (guanine-N(7)-)-methyltransferase n=2 Tax=Pseudonocardiaceae TaxID=2070 RepID=A0ABY2SC21_9PSEU|nr:MULTISPECIES: tRNA (guanosine(46)-N7)-methyltransferase TrmB [Prauserella]PXY34735.1 tRNA (guanosine(46)-N7)-methyltransferase TrmB [Prauserella coralliicola]RBM23727.1 tRNA (guanosine(46)-N7)-methyltransferase TrmB [Prauserella sp. PE36]TKG73266.1 tRNA (guanosine(46)-N7)-methyltransferase TrmB [Prauserella endophytica]
MDSEQEPRMRSVVSYVKRGGRMTAGQQRAWETRWPELGRTVSELPPGPIDFAAWFGRPAPVILEIGSGMGETTSQLAAASPEVNYVAVEVYEAGLGQLMLRAERLGVVNLRLLHGDAVPLLTEHVAKESLAGVRIFFPDPWPKKRHHKRRLVQPDFVALVASRLASGGTLHLATDWENYAEQMLEVCGGEPTLRNRFDGWAPRPEWRPVTKFEQRAEEEGRVSRDLIFEKLP